MRYNPLHIPLLVIMILVIFEDLLNAYEKNHSRFLKLKEKHAVVITQIDTLSHDISELKSENDSLKCEIDVLRKGKSIDKSNDFEIENTALKEEVEDLEMNKPSCKVP